MNGMKEHLQHTVATLRDYGDFRPEVGLVLGSGLGGLVDLMEVTAAIPYRDIPHFAESTVAGHSGRLVFGRIGAVPVVAMQGRFHYYEGHPMRSLAYPIACMRELGVTRLVVSNSAGGLNPGFVPGDLMLISDHINLFGDNPLIGLNDDELGPRFPDMTAPYDPGLMARADGAAAALGFEFRRGVYAGVTGPNYETAAEIRYLRTIGADAVGMSTVPEVIAARYLGLQVLGITCITNMATGIAETPHSHAEVVKTAQAAADRFCRVVMEIVAGLEGA
ncbi:purine-nucleoside phosphorylase [Spirochaeta africana]|uniref:Purine nucleoside phosphorylase n=1 Tax=Spirochaeta africana (strain ATCC 700263 / DSM 8902 / Z-7692) TaxID=889378 RepID=H9UIC3_SPIAZ|nr:purine-nucleoside phosphorylase [Spirochaeta africana]AFG37266.1 purine nucleoside phosphorylase I, inosine and guanosine-specific [Spirochaeta africana DSM 8902]